MSRPSIKISDAIYTLHIKHLLHWYSRLVQLSQDGQTFFNHHLIILNAGKTCPQCTPCTNESIQPALIVLMNIAF